MVVRTSCVLALALCITAGTALPREPREPHEVDDVGAEETKQTRPLEPTEEDLAAFRLTESQIDYVATPDKSPAFRASAVGMIAASAADLVSTEVGLSRGYAEGNPAASRRGVRIATHVIGPAVLLWATERMHRSGKTKLSLGLRIGLMVAYSYAAIHNAHLMGSAP